MAKRNQNQGVVIVFDVSQSMRTTQFQDAIKAAQLFIKGKLKTFSKDVMGLILVGTVETDNHLNDEDEDQYKNIMDLYKNLQECRVDMIRDIRELEKYEHVKQGDLIDALIVACDKLYGSDARLVKRIVLITDGGQARYTQEEYDQLQKPFHRADIRLNVYGINGFLDTTIDKKKTTDQMEIELQFKKLCESLGESSVALPCREVIEFFENDLRTTKTISQTTVFRGLLEVGDKCAIPLYAYKKTDKAALPPPKKNSLMSKLKTGGGKVIRSTTYSKVDDPDEAVESEDRIKAYRYGRNTVPINPNDEKQLRFKSNKCCEALGFTSAKNVPRHLYMDCSYVMMAPPSDETAQLALSTLVRAMYEMDYVVIVRYCFRSNATPQLGVLSPHIKSKGEGLLLNYLPFAEDIRVYPFRSFSDINISTGAQKIADDLVDSMDMMEDDKEMNEHMKASHTYDPVQLRFQQCLLSRALSRDTASKLPLELNEALSEHALNLSYPEAAKDSFYQRSLSRNATIRKAFSEKFPTERVVSDTREHSNKVNFWFAIAEEDEQLSLASFHASSSIKAEEESAVPVKMTKGLDSSAPYNPSEDDELVSAVERESLLSNIASHVGTVKPILDFNQMISRRDMDLVDRAIDEMSKVIVRLIENSVRDLYYEKAVHCLIALRKGCVQEEEPYKYNNFLRQIRTSFLSHHRHGAFYDLLSKDHRADVGFITEDEVPDSDVLNAEKANEFWSTDSSTNSTQQPAASSSLGQNLSQDEEDLLDDLVY
eukprot:CAMPEP_0117422930 /NCGR_PEP_ID=MMETSP0758-20121206/3687_1 /TAXON_ID=63605 /ORGANISM="Percolomonas cosmopolitus, Strain AE-1 (ATCC 50343)" /LENGTH=767 /DNA_ID=CAMNT_0005205877 /DNA_START=123 /DNA_END=2426 /DNA_ORIENTATION=+